MLLDRSHEESQNVNFVQNHSVATVNSLVLTLLLQLDVTSVEKESVYFFPFHFGVSACIHSAANFDLVYLSPKALRICCVDMYGIGQPAVACCVSVSPGLLWGYRPYGSLSYCIPHTSNF